MVGGTGLAPARALSPAEFESAVSADSNHAAKLVQTERLALSRACAHRHLGPARMLFRHVCKMDPARRLALRSSRYQRDASLPTLGRQKLVETEGLAPPQSVKTARLQRAAIAALPRLENGGSGGSRTRTDTAYETVALLLCYRAKVVGRLGNAPSSAG